MTQANELELYMLDLINAERTSRGLSELALETNLNTSAETHSEWMLETNTFSHSGAGGSSATDRMREAEFDLSGAWQTAENIAIQSERGEPGLQDDVEDLHQSLMESPGHRANLLNPDLDYIGIGIEAGDFTYDSGFSGESVIVTQNFGATQGEVDLDPGTGAVSAEPAMPVATAPDAVDAQPATPSPATPEAEPVAEANPQPFDLAQFLNEFGDVFELFFTGPEPSRSEGGLAVWWDGVHSTLEGDADTSAQVQSDGDAAGAAEMPLSPCFMPMEADLFG